jgi:hypothetical protein
LGRPQQGGPFHFGPLESSDFVALGDMSIACCDSRILPSEKVGFEPRDRSASVTKRNWFWKFTCLDQFADLGTPQAYKFRKVA